MLAPSLPFFLLFSLRSLRDFLAMNRWRKDAIAAEPTPLFAETLA
ncbi:MAG: hypothetical protein QNL68_19340 [Akkermansiaceae bacterium]